MDSVRDVRSTGGRYVDIREVEFEYDSPRLSPRRTVYRMTAVGEESDNIQRCTFQAPDQRPLSTNARDTEPKRIREGDLPSSPFKKPSWPAALTAYSDPPSPVPSTTHPSSRTDPAK